MSRRRFVIGIELRVALAVGALVALAVLAAALWAATEHSGGGGRAPGARLAFTTGAFALAIALPLVAVAIVARHARRLEREVAERQAAERQLRDSRRVLAESEIRFRRLYEGIAAGVLTVGPDRKPRSANPALLRMLGYADERALLEANFGDEVYAGPGTFEALLQRVRAHGELANVELRLRRRDGFSVAALATWRAAWDDTGEVETYEASLLDVTETKIAESRRRATELRFRRLFDSNAVGVVIGNVRRRTLDDANDYLLELLGLRASELPVPLGALTPEDYLELDRRNGAELQANGRIPPIRREYLHRDGTRVPVLAGAALVDAAQGDFIGVVIDRRAEVEAERLLAATTSFYELLLDRVPTRIAHVDAGERVVYANRAYREWFGGGAPMVGRTVRELVGAAAYAQFAPEIRRVLAGATVRFTAVVPRDGRAHELDVTYVPSRDARGRVDGFLSFVHDLHGRDRPAAPAAWPAAG